MSTRQTLIALPLLLIVVASGVHAGAATSFDVMLADSASVDVPDKTYSTQWGDITITQIGRHTAGDTLTVSAQAPDEIYDVRIVDSQERVLATQTGSGSQTFSFNLANYESGSYTVAITQEADSKTEVRAAEPFVVRGFALNVDAPDNATVGDSLTVSVEVTRLQSAATNEGVTFVFGNETTFVERSATTQDGKYVADIDTDRFAADKYRLYAVVENGETYNGEDMYSGLSMSHTVTLEAATSDSSGSTGSSGSGGATQPTQPVTSTSTTTPPTTSTPTTAPPTTTRTTQAPTTTTTPIPTTHIPQSPSPDPTTTTSTTTQSTESPLDTTSRTTPGFSMVATLLGIGLTSLALGRRRD